MRVFILHFTLAASDQRVHDQKWMTKNVPVSSPSRQHHSYAMCHVISLWLILYAYHTHVLLHYLRTYQLQIKFWFDFFNLFMCCWCGLFILYFVFFLGFHLSLYLFSKLGVAESVAKFRKWQWVWRVNMKRGSGELVGSPGVGLHGGSWQPPSLSLSYHTLLTFTPYHTKLYVLCIRNNPILSPILTKHFS